MSKLGIIAALPAEVACLTNKKLDVFTPAEIENDIFLCLSGIGYESASIAAKRCLDLKVNGLISWGVAGAINTSLNSGDLIFAESVISEGSTYQTSTDWKNKLLAHFQEIDYKVLNSNIASNREICASTEDKINLLNETGAVAVDMESAAIAETAINNHLDFIVIRSIADKAKTAIPEAVINHTDNLGNPEILNFVKSCILKPAQIRDITVLAKSYKTALKTLNKIASDLKNKNFFYD